MTDAERATLVLVKALAAVNKFFLLPHARERMAERGAKIADVRAALTGATVCVDQRGDAGRTADWAVTGADREGVSLTCAVRIEGSVVVVTLY